jgi:hypothetical protein
MALAGRIEEHHWDKIHDSGIPAVHVYVFILFSFGVVLLVFTPL